MAALASVTRVHRDTSPWAPALRGAWGPTRGGDPRGVGTRTPAHPPGSPAEAGIGPHMLPALFAAPAEAAPPRPVPSRPPGAAPGRAGHLKRGRAAAAPCAFPP